jgi:amidase
VRIGALLRGGGVICLGVAILCAAPPDAAPAADSFDPAYAGIDELHAALVTGQIRCETLVGRYLDRIARLDRRGPGIGSLITVDATAAARAREFDAVADSPLRSSRLYCIPFVAKDNFDTQGVATSGGTLVLRGSLPAGNAAVVQRLEDAGAILLGKANMSELAASYGRLGYSAAGGLTLNPYNLSRDVSGSSSGSAAAVAADFAVFALGTDTSGSVRGPAGVSGLIGIRPSMGLLSGRGVMPSSRSLDTPGVMTHTARDAATVLGVMAEAAAEPAAVPATLAGRRFGIIDAFAGGSEEIDASAWRMQALLVEQGAMLLHVALPERFTTLWGDVLEPVTEAEFKTEFERYLRTLSPLEPRTLAEFIRRSVVQEGRHALHPMNPRLLAALRRAQSSPLAGSPAYARILTTLIPSLRAELRALMDQAGVEALLFPTMSCPATPRFNLPDRSYVCHAADPYAVGYVASATGFPEVTLPAQLSSVRVPIGFSLLGRPHDDMQLLALAAAIETANPPLPHPVLFR